MSETMVRQAAGYELPVFPFRRAPEQDGKGKRYPVVIVGGGLTGLTAACDLASRGIPCVLLDEDDTVGVRGASSRGICYAQRSLEIFERFGIYERVAAKGVTWSVGRIMRNDEEVYAFDLAAGSSSRQPPFINIQQFYVEWYLVDRLAELPLADLRWKNRVVGARLGDDHVALEVQTPEGSYTLEAEWVIDASGVASAVRLALGIETRSSQGVDRWCISDVRFTKPLPPERWTWVEAEFNEGRAVWQHQMADNVWRIDYQMASDADPEAVSGPDVVQARLRDHLGPDTEVELVWVGPWGYRTHLLEDFRHGRVFFAGDAAHVFSPFGARGGNSGIQDAENISWKLGAVIHGLASERILDSYSPERRLAASLNISTTERSARFVAPRSRFEHVLRNAVLDLCREHEFARRLVNMGRMSEPYHYAASALSTNGGEAFPNLALVLPDGEQTTVARMLGGDGIRMLLLAGPGSPALPPLPPYVAAYAAGLEAAGLPVVSGEKLGTLVRPDEIVVLRPDQHVAARLVRPSAQDVEGAVCRVLGRDAPDKQEAPRV